MKKNATVEEKVNAIAKALVKKFKENDNAKEIGITSYFDEEYNHDSKKYEYFFEFDGLKIPFGEMSEQSFGGLTCQIGNLVCETIRKKLKKNEIIHRVVNETSYGSWWSNSTYSTFKKIVIVRLCKEFVAINKKLKALGLNELKFGDLYVDYVSGKRSHIYDHDIHYYSENSAMCKKILAFLKGKKKLTYKFFDDDDLENREYGERYETEWDGKMSKKICFVDAKGHENRIY